MVGLNIVCRGMDDSFTRSIKLAEEKNLVHEEGKASLEMSENKPDITTGVSDKNENVDDVSSEGETTTVVTSEDVKLLDPLQRWKDPDQSESQLPKSHNVASIRESGISKSGERTDRHQKATPSKTSRHKKNKFKRRTSHDPFHALISSAETVSSNMAPPVAHSTADTVGSSNGFTEAFEEVLKLASEANKTAGEKPAELQDKSSMTELLPTDKPVELDVQVVEGTDMASQIQKSVSSEDKDTVVSVGLSSEEQRRDGTVGGDNDALGEVTHDSRQTDSTLSRADESKAVADGSKIVADGSKAVIDESKIVADESKAVADKSEVVADESKTVADESKAVSDASKAVPGESKAVVDVKSAFSAEKPDDGVVSEQVLQAEVRPENSVDWSQESAVVSLLKQRAASGTLKVGLLNMEAADLQHWQFLAGELPLNIPFERVNEKVEWNHLYPEWIDEEERYEPPQCPSIPMPKVSPGVQLDVVIARAPCTASSALQEGWKHPASFQVLLGP